MPANITRRPKFITSSGVMGIPLRAASRFTSHTPASTAATYMSPYQRREKGPISNMTGLKSLTPQQAKAGGVGEKLRRTGDSVWVGTVRDLSLRSPHFVVSITGDAYGIAGKTAQGGV